MNHKNLTTLTQKELTFARKKIGMIFQHYNLLSSKNIFSNIALPLSLENHNRDDIEHTVHDLLDLVGLTHKAQHYPSQLSGGQKQRVAIARALVNNPDVLLCDEITSALDPETASSILTLLRKIQKKRNMAILFVTHDMNVIKNIADRVVVIDQGTIIEDSSVINIFKNPKTAIAKSLTGTCFHCDLPSNLTLPTSSNQPTWSSAMIRIKFSGQPAVEPIIDELIRHYSLRINIYKANLEYIHSESMGMMLISAQGNKSDINSALLFLDSKRCQTEILELQ